MTCIFLAMHFQEMQLRMNMRAGWAAASPWAGPAGLRGRGRDCVAMGPAGRPGSTPVGRR
jgi:hypothetical protein